MDKNVFLLVEPDKSNKIYAVKKNLITSGVRDKYKIAGYIYLEDKYVDFIKNKKVMPIEVIVHLPRKKIIYLENLFSDKLRKKAGKLFVQHGYYANLDNLNDRTLRQKMLGFEDIEGDLCTDNLMNIYFSNIHKYKEKLEKIGKANFYFKTLLPFFSLNIGVDKFNSKPTLCIREKPFPVVY